MKKRWMALTLVFLMCFSMVAYADEGTGLSFRAMPGYTCLPLMAESGHFYADRPMEWFGGDASEEYGVPTAATVEPSNLNHMVIVCELCLMDQVLIMLDDEHPLAAFLQDGLKVIQGEDTEQSRILEKTNLHGLPATKVEMVGQGFEMIWIVDPDEEIQQMNQMGFVGNMWFIMYPTDPDDEAYTETVSGIIDSFTISGVYSYGPGSLADAPASDFLYTVDGEEVRLDAYIGEKDYVKVPAEIEGKPVTSMGDQVFYETPVRCVSFPDSIREMGTNTFGGCTKLVYVFLPAALETLPTGTFESCFRLKEPWLNDGLKKIEEAAFWGDMVLTSLYLPETLEEIEDGAFEICNNLERIGVPTTNTHFRGNDEGTILFSADGELLVWYSLLNNETEYTVPAGVKRIYANAFRNAPLTDISLPEGLSYIGQGAFSGTQIKEIHIPESVTQLGIMQNVRIGDSQELVTAEFISIGESIQTVYGVPGSAAEKYAEINKLTFIPE